MFGYVRPSVPELRICDYECYRSYYCGLCRSMGSCTGQCSRMSLNYDFVFLALIRCYLTEEKPTFKKKWCLAHPFQRRTAVIGSEQLNYCSDVSALLTYQKCQDDVLDEKGFRKFRARLARAFFSGAYRRAKKRHPELNQKIAEELDRLHRYEQEHTQPSADTPAEIFGELMKAVFSDGLSGTPGRLAAEIGRNIGKWIYLVDAADDIEDDSRRGSFNPYLALFGTVPKKEDRSLIQTALTAILCDAEKAYLLFDDPPCPEVKEILSNIFYLGLPQTANKVLTEEDSKKQKKKHTTEKETSHE